MSEITTKLPYVAGYNIKMAFVIQDLKNLDEIYGETSRHSLMGNCGYQLVFGANDQATAEMVSKSLGKRTIRYTTESRTIELMGLHRRTKVEQLRERDLMMPQEVRQMPSSKMVILAEGQGPILADKLRFFATPPFDRMEAFSRANIPEVPALEFLPQVPVPATTENYAGRGTHHDAQLARTGTERPGGMSADRTATGGSASTSPAIERVPRPFLNSPQTAWNYGQQRQEEMWALEARFATAARKLKTLVREKSKPNAAAPARDWSSVFDETVPDESDVLSHDVGTKRDDAN